MDDYFFKNCLNIKYLLLEIKKIQLSDNVFEINGII